MTRLKQLAFYYGMNGIFGACVYLGFYGVLEPELASGAKNIAVFIGWFTGIAGVIYVLGMNIPDVRKEMAKSLYEKNWQPSAPYVLDLVFDLWILGTFIWFGHYWLSAFYVLSLIASKGLRELQKEYTFKNLIEDCKNA